MPPSQPERQMVYFDGDFTRPVGYYNIRTGILEVSDPRTRAALRNQPLSGLTLQATVASRPVPAHEGKRHNVSRKQRRRQTQLRQRQVHSKAPSHPSPRDRAPREDPVRFHVYEPPRPTFDFTTFMYPSPLYY